VCGAFLAKVGHHVTILEGKQNTGGMCVTEELIPGYNCAKTILKLQQDE
jgi:phytoene dehydrogenase-like protein